MIVYEAWGPGGIGLLLQVSGSVLPKACVWGLIGAALTAAMWSYVNFVSEEDFFGQFIYAWGSLHPYAHQIFSVYFLGLLLVFRANMSYQRFWEGRTSLEEMTSSWTNACIQLYSFQSVSKLPQSEKEDFQRNLIHLFSLMHALAIAKLQGSETGELDFFPVNSYDEAHKVNEENQTILGIIGELKPVERKELLKGKQRCYMVMTWLLRAITKHHCKGGGLGVPPPILSRSYVALSAGLAAFMQARKTAETPFPFPYAQLMVFVLLAFEVTAPVVFVNKVLNVFPAMMLAFVSCSAFAWINEVAKEIEDPFGLDPNDLPMAPMHNEFLERLYDLTDRPFDPSFMKEIVPAKKGQLATGAGSSAGVTTGQLAGPAFALAQLDAQLATSSNRRSSGGGGGRNANEQKPEEEAAPPPPPKHRRGRRGTITSY